MRETIIRDFAYPPSDNRHRGIYPDITVSAEAEGRAGRGYHFHNSTSSSSTATTTTINNTKNSSSTADATATAAAAKSGSSKDEKDEHQQLLTTLSSPEEEDDSDGEVDYTSWQWKWSYNYAKVKKTSNAPPIIDIKDLHLKILPELCAILQRKDPAIPRLTLVHSKTVFPFVKGTEYEMSLESLEELLVISQVTPDPPPPPASTTALTSVAAAESSVIPAAASSTQSPQLQALKKEAASEGSATNTNRSPGDDKKERWSSIDELAAPTSNEKELMEFILDPPLDAFLKEVDLFFTYNKLYGDGWQTALKVKMFVSFEKKKVRVQLVDLGLVPANYLGNV